MRRLGKNRDSNLIAPAIGGIYVLSIWKRCQNTGVIPQPDASQALSKDDLASVRAFFAQHFEDLQRLEGTRVWMKSGYTMLYSSYTGGQVEFALVLNQARTPRTHGLARSQPPLS
jgi:isopenicillin N synthase-like dioxygenase